MNIRCRSLCGQPTRLWRKETLFSKNSVLPHIRHAQAGLTTPPGNTAISGGFALLDHQFFHGSARKCGANRLMASDSLLSRARGAQIPHQSMSGCFGNRMTGRAISPGTIMAMGFVPQVPRSIGCVPKCIINAIHIAAADPADDARRHFTTTRPCAARHAGASPHDFLWRDPCLHTSFVNRSLQRTLRASFANPQHVAAGGASRPE